MQIAVHREREVQTNHKCAVRYVSLLASFPVLPTPAFISQPWIKAGVGRTGNEAMFLH